MTRAAPTPPAAVAPSFPAGFTGATGSAAIKKPGRDDIALIICGGGKAAHGVASAAGVFTRNQVAAAPVLLSKRHLAASKGRISAVLINSGCANAATGSEGLARAQECVDALAGSLGVDPTSILVNSTGVIGVQLPAERMVPVIRKIAREPRGGSVAPVANAILTTDTYAKCATRRVTQGANSCTVTGVAKGAGMIHPDMATMISVVMTDAAVEPAALDRMLRRAVDRSFHRISIDGDTSTNDSVFLLASGEAGSFPEEALQGAMTEVMRELALMIVRDGEGFERGIEVRVTGARTNEDALQVARTIAGSLLVRCAVTGGDPNWGRIVAAAGRSGVPFDLETIRLSVGGVSLFEKGRPALTPLSEREAAFRAPHVLIELELGAGSAGEEFFSCGLTESYVRLNADYTT